MGARDKARGRFSSRRKTEAVLRADAGRGIGRPFKEIAMAAATLAQWWERGYTQVNVREHRVRYNRTKIPSRKHIPLSDEPVQ